MARSKRCALLGAGAIEGHEAGEAGPLLAFAQRTEIVGNALGQHRHDAIGEIDGIAADARLAVERRAGAHIGGDIGDGDDDLDAAFIRRIVIGLGPHRIVMIARVRRIDGDERHDRADRSRLARAKGLELGRLARARASGNSVGMPCWWMAMSEMLRWSLRSPSRSRTRAAARPRPRSRMISASTSSPGLRAAFLARLHLQFVARLLVDRHDARAVALGDAEDAEDARSARPISLRMTRP